MVLVCATKLAWPASGSTTVSVPVLVVVPSSVTAPVLVPPITAASLLPVTVMVIARCVPSSVATVK